jgi:hypothetical protein
MKPLFPNQDALAKVCKKHRIQRLALFGSVLKGRARSDSDIDLLVEFEPGATPGLLHLAEIDKNCRSYSAAGRSTCERLRS